MSSTIQLDHQLLLSAAEIHDIWWDWELSNEFVTVDSTIAQELP